MSNQNEKRDAVLGNGLSLSNTRFWDVSLGCFYYSILPKRFTRVLAVLVKTLWITIGFCNIRRYKMAIAGGI